MIRSSEPLSGDLRSRLVVAVDGPGGAGKGSVCRAVAKRFHFAYLDTGLLYRAVAMMATRCRIDPSWIDDPGHLALLASELSLEFRPMVGSDLFGTYLQGEEVTQALRAEAVGDAASRLAAMPEVRQALLTFQRRFGEPRPLILDGRDTGSVVFPDADVKIFLSASLDIRADRRVRELHDRGEDASMTEIRARLAERDQRDAMRAHAPLLPASDAMVIDTTGLTLAESVERVCLLVEGVLALRGEPSPADDNCGTAPFTTSSARH